MKTAVAILNYNGKKWLEKFLPTVLLHSDTAEIYVIDNASTDDSVKYLADHFPSIKIVQNPENFGFAEGYNRGLRYINADIFCLLNSDAEVTANWIQPALDLFAKDSSIAAIQPKILDFNRKSHFEFAGAAGGMLDNLGYPYCRGRIFENIEQDHGQYDGEAEIAWASGCCLFIRANDFREQNGFDERFFAHQEEIDLCWRLRNIGKKIYYTSKSTVYHVGGGTLSKQSPQKTLLNFRNNLTMLLKNLPAEKILPVILSRLILDGLAGIYLGFKLGIQHTIAVIRAHFGFYRMSAVTFKHRGSHQMKNYYTAKYLLFRKRQRKS